MLCSLTCSRSSSFLPCRRLLSNFNSCSEFILSLQSLCRVGEQEERGRREGYKRRWGGGGGGGGGEAERGIKGKRGKEEGGEQ